MDFGGKAVLITGGSSGIGLALATLLAERGASIWLVARGEDRLRSALSMLEGKRLRDGQRFGYTRADVSDPNQASRAVEEATNAAGPLDIVVNAAGFAQPGYVQELDLSIFREMMDIDYFGTVYITKAALPGMIARRAGHIVNISSLAGVIAVFGYSAYGPAKFAVRGFSDILRAEMKPYGVRVSIVFPPNTDTPGFAHENLFKPPETKAIEGAAKTVPPQAVAQAIIRGIEHGKYLIIPGFEGKAFYWLSGWVGTGIYPVMDWLVASAQKKMRATTR